MVGHNSGQKNVLLYGQQIECPDQKTGHCQKWIALWSGHTECPDLVRVMVGHNSVHKIQQIWTALCPFRDHSMGTWS